MDRRINEIIHQVESFAPFEKHVEGFYAELDSAYQAVADGYGFACSGCEDNCCRSRFSHHTLLELVYLRTGLRRLDFKVRTGILNRARINLEKQSVAHKAGTNLRMMCPANMETQCLLYAYRPMICRLHGIPHELTLPDQRVRHGRGCAEFDRRHHRRTYIRFDRTPLYANLSDCERRFRQKTGIYQKIKMTVAEMLML